MRCLIAERVEREETIGAFLHFGADLLEPGIVQLGYEVPIRVDELDGRITPRGESLKKALEYAMLTRVTENIWGCLWGKLVFQKA